MPPVQHLPPKKTQSASPFTSSRRLFITKSRLTSPRTNSARSSISRLLLVWNQVNVAQMCAGVTGQHRVNSSRRLHGAETQMAVPRIVCCARISQPKRGQMEGRAAELFLFVLWFPDEGRPSYTTVVGIITVSSHFHPLERDNCYFLDWILHCTT